MNVGNPRTRFAGSHLRSKAGGERFAYQPAPIHRMSILAFTLAVKRLKLVKFRPRAWYTSG